MATDGGKTITEVYDDMKKTPEGRRQIVREMVSTGIDETTIRSLGYGDELDEKESEK